MLYIIGNEPKSIDKHPTTGNKQGQIKGKLFLLSETSDAPMSYGP